MSGLLSLLLEQWEDQEVDTALEHSPGEAGTSDIVNLGAGLEGLDDLAAPEEPQAPPAFYCEEIARAENAAEEVQPAGLAEVAVEETIDTDAELIHCFDLIPVESEEEVERITAPEAEVEPVCTETEIAALTHADLRLDEPPEELETWNDSSSSFDIFVEEFERTGNGSEWIDPVLESEPVPPVDDLLEASSEPPQVDESIQHELVSLEAELATAEAIEQIEFVPLEAETATADAVEQTEFVPFEVESATADAIEPAEEAELGEADLRMLFDSLVSDSEGFEEIAEVEPDGAANQTADEPGEIESFEPISAASDENLLGLLLGGITAIHQVSQIEPEPEPQQPRPQATAEPPAPKAEPPAPKGPVERFVVFRLGSDSYAVPLQRVVETDRMPRVTFVPGLPASLRGISNLRGDIIPIIDLRHAMGMGETEITVANRLVVVRATAESSVGLIVDGLAGLGAFWVDRSEGRNKPEQTGVAETVNTQLLNGCGEHKGQPVEVLDLDKVLLAAELQELAA